jgi:hypothetical protein
MTQREYAEQIAQVAIERGRPRSSVKLETGPRGQVMVGVTVHTGDEPGLDTIEQVVQRARAVFDTLRAVYGITSGPVVSGTGAAASAASGDTGD